MAARLISRINSNIAALTGHDDSHNNDQDMFTEDDLLPGSLEDIMKSSIVSSHPAYTYSDVLAGPDVYDWSNNYYPTAQLDDPFNLVPSSSSSAAHESIEDDQILDMPWDGQECSSSSSLQWPVDQWSPPCSTTNYGNPESCSFTAVMDSPLHLTDRSQHSDITDQNSLQPCQLNALSLDTLLQSWSSAEAHDQTAAMAACYDAFPACCPQLQNAASSKMPSRNDGTGRMEDDIAATSSTSEDSLVHKFCIECNKIAIDDGYTWRKYGEKNIMGRAYRRGYFRCAQSGCIVKKQVEKSSDKEGFVLITYFGKHNHHPTHKSVC